MGVNNHVTIQDVADEANVSTTTVSRVLNQPSKVSSATRERVTSIIDELGYVPNETAKRLAQVSSPPQGDESDALLRDLEERVAATTTFEGQWTNRERRSVLEALARHSKEGVWIFVKTQPGADVLFAAMEMQGADWTIRTGDSIRELVFQLHPDIR